MKRKRWLHEFSWYELEEALAGIDTALIPTGSIEEEGRHLPLGVDTLVASEVASRVVEKVDAIVTPPLWVSYSEWHSGFKGTLSLRQDTVVDVLRQICEQLILYGFKRFLFVNAHVGNDEPIAIVSNTLRAQHNVVCAMVNLWSLANELAQNEGDFVESRFTHAGEIMTSVMLALHPNLVRLDLAQAESIRSESSALTQENSSRVRYREGHAKVYRLSSEVTKSGAMGDPGSATREKGEKVLEAWIDYLIGFVQELQRLSTSKDW